MVAFPSRSMSCSKHRLFRCVCMVGGRVLALISSRHRRHGGLMFRAASSSLDRQCAQQSSSRQTRGDQVVPRLGPYSAPKILTDFVVVELCRSERARGGGAPGFFFFFPAPQNRSAFRVNHIERHPKARSPRGHLDASDLVFGMRLYYFVPRESRTRYGRA